MKKTFTVLFVISGFIALIFSVLPISNLAIFPAIFSVVSGGFAYYLSKKTGEVKKIIPFALLITICALSLTTYKALFVKTEVADTTILNEKELLFEEEAIQELDNLDIENISIEDIQNIETEPKKIKLEDVEINQSSLETIEFEDIK